MILPEWALEGTVTSRPWLVWCRRAPGEVRLMCAPAERGNATVMPLFRPTPPMASVPRIDTWCGMALHLEAGTQRTLVMRTLRTWRLMLPVPTGEEAAEGALPSDGSVPPGLAATDTRGSSSGHRIPTTSARAPTTDRLCTSVLAKMIPSRRTSVLPARMAPRASPATCDLTGSADQ